jgi:phasin
MDTMSDTPKSKTKTATVMPVPGEFPKMEMPKMEMPAAFRDFAEKGISQAKESYEKLKSAAEEATDMMEDTFATAAKGASDYNRKMIEIARTNTNAAFDFATELFGVKTISEVVELATSHVRKQFETAAAQSKELASLAQKVAADTAEPMKDSMSKVFKQAA